MQVVARSPAQAGFTLLEVMVVLAMAGILITLSVISYQQGGDGARTRIEAQRLAAYIQAAQEEAALMGHEMALSIEDEGYSFLRLEEGKWIRMEQDRSFKPYSLPTAMRVDIEIQGSGSVSASGRKQALVLILSSGEITPFNLRLRAADGSEQGLRMDFMGQAQFYKPGAKGHE